MAIAKLIALLAVAPAALFATSVQAQSRSDGEACLQAKQAENDALNAEDWPSVITNVKRRVAACWWNKSPKSIASAELLTGMSHFFLGDMTSAAGWLEACQKTYYSYVECHYWLAVTYRRQGREQEALRQKQIALSIARRTIATGIPSYVKDPSERQNYETDILVARSTIENLKKF